MLQCQGGVPGPQQFVPGSRRPATKSQQESLLSAPSYGEEDVAFRLSTSALLEEEIVAPHPSQSSSLPALDSFEHAGPLIITQDPRASSQVVSTDPRGHVPLNMVVSVETATFSGCMRNVIRGCPGAPEEEFRGTKSLGKCVIQGTFKVPTAAKDLWVGQELLNKPLLPASFQRLVFTTAAKIFSSTYRVMVEGDGADAVGYLNPLMALATTINVSRPGQQPDLVTVQEDMQLLDSSLVDKQGQPLSSSARQRYFDKPSNLEGVVFDTEHVYTFVICQGIVDMPSYRLKLGALINLDLCPVLNGQPLQMLCKNVQNDEVIMSLLVWHKHLNYPPGRLRRACSDASNSSRSYSYRHSRAGSQDTSSGGSCLYSSSSVGSSLCSSSSSASSDISGIESSGDSLSIRDDDACSVCGAECDSDSSSECSSDADYHSCVDEHDTLFWEADNQQHLDALAAMQAVPSTATALYTKLPTVLETAFSAPAGSLHYPHAELCDESDPAPVNVTVIASGIGLGAGAAVAAAALRPPLPRSRSSTGGGGSSSSSAKRKSGRKAAAAAVASAARRVAARFRKSCPGLSTTA